MKRLFTVKRLLLTMAVVGALAVAAVAVVGVAAQTGTPTASPTGTPLDKLFEKVAEKLGITQDQLTNAVKSSETDLIDEAVANGTITQDRANQLKDRIANSDKIILPGMGRHGKGGGHLEAGAALDTAAGVLGIDKDTLMNDLRNGQSLAEIAQAQGKNVDDFKAALLDSAHQKLNDLVGQGKLTQDKADQMFQGLSDHIDQIINAHHTPGEGHGHGRFGGRGFGGPGFEGPSGSPSPSTSTFQ